MTAIEFMESWFDAPIPKNWDRDYEPLQNVTVNGLAAMMDAFAEHTLLQGQISTISPNGVQDKGTMDYSAENKGNGK